MIFVFFKPLVLKKQSFINVPQIELKDFTMYEFSPDGLQTYMLGKSGIKFDDRFIVNKIDYTDKSEDYIATMKADRGQYEGNIVKLEGDVFYTRDNGFGFKTQKLVYNKKTSQAISDVGYIAYMGDNIVKGSYIRYNNDLDRVYSKQIDPTYQLQERNE